MYNFLLNIKKYAQNEFKPIFVYTIAFLIAVIFFKYKMMNLYIDFSREVIVPKSILQGEVLYKDIFVLYGPLSYLSNAFFLKIFGVNLKVFNLIGAVNTYAALFGIYLISRNFLDKFLSCSICCFVIFCCAFVPSVTNYITPYSYAMVFGITSIIFSAVFALEYIKNKRNNFLYVSFFFAGIAFANKFDFVFCLIPLLFAAFKQMDFKKLINSLSLWLFPSLASYIFLFFQGLRLSDLKNYSDIIFRYVHSPFLQKFYDGTMFFSLKNFLLETVMFICFAVLFYCLYKILSLCEKKQIKYCAWTVCPCLIVLLYNLKIFSTTFVFCFFPLLLLTAMWIKISEIRKDPTTLFISVMTVCVCAKTLFFLNTVQYGRYFLPFLVLSLIIIFRNYVFKNNEKIFEKTLAVFLVGITAANFFINLNIFKKYDTKLQTKYGVVYTSLNNKRAFDSILDYIDKNTNKNDKVVVLRESAIINFLADRKTDNYFNHLDIVSFDALKEDNIIKHYSVSGPEYFIVFVQEHNDDSFCIGYGVKTCKWINENYKLQTSIKSDYDALIFKRK